MADKYNLRSNPKPTEKGELHRKTITCLEHNLDSPADNNISAKRTAAEIAALPTSHHVASPTAVTGIDLLPPIDQATRLSATITASETSIADSPVMSPILSPVPHTLTETNVLNNQQVLMILQQLATQTADINEKLTKQTADLNEKLNLQTKQTADLNLKMDHNMSELDRRFELLHLNINNQFHDTNRRIDNVEKAQDVSKNEILNIHHTQLQQSNRVTVLEERVGKVIDDIQVTITDQYQSIITDQLPKLGLDPTTMTAQKEELKILKDTTRRQEEKILQLEDDINRKTAIPSPPQPTILVSCNGNGIPNFDANPPKFNGRGINPQEFLNRFKRHLDHYISKLPTTTDTTETMLHLAELCLDGHAARWLAMIKDTITDWNDFKRKFEQRYWNRDFQRGVRHRLDNEKYCRDAALSRSEYFEERVLILKSFVPPLSEEEILVCMAEHFSPTIQDAIRVQNITTVEELNRLLQREDIRDPAHRNRRPRTQRHDINPQRRDQQLDHPRPLQQTYSKPPFIPRQYQGPPPRPPPHYRQTPPPPRHRSHQHEYEYRPDNLQPSTSPRNHPYYRSDDRRPPNRYEQRSPSPSRNPPKRKPYPTNEQHQVCTTIATTTPKDVRDDGNTCSPPLNK